MFAEANLRQGSKKAAQAALKEVAAIHKSAVKLKALMTTFGAGSRGSLIRFTDETILRFGRFIKGEVIETAAGAQAQKAGLGEAKGDALEAGTDGEAGPIPDGANGG